MPGAERSRQSRWRPTFGIQIRADAAEYNKLELVRYAAAGIARGSLMLDAGAGDCPHRDYFQHARYESCDWAQNSAGSLTFQCDVQNIPKPDNWYDAVVCIHVIDEVPHPQKAINELFRVLKPGGSLFLTAPFLTRLHTPPHHYFDFAYYGLELLFRNAGFRINFIRSHGGVFSSLSYLCRRLPSYLYQQHWKLIGQAKTRTRRWLRRVVLATLFPAYILALPLFRYLLPLVFFYLDALDQKCAFTIGYSCHCIKPERCSQTESGAGDGSVRPSG